MRHLSFQVAFKVKPFLCHFRLAIALDKMDFSQN
jgi:hypothetical protein